MPLSDLTAIEMGEGEPTWETGKRLAQGIGLPLSALAVVAELVDKGLIELVGEPGSGPGAAGR
jgi:hypothetical protein